MHQTQEQHIPQILFNVKLQLTQIVIDDRFSNPC